LSSRKRISKKQTKSISLAQEIWRPLSFSPSQTTDTLKQPKTRSEQSQLALSKGAKAIKAASKRKVSKECFSTI